MMFKSYLEYRRVSDPHLWATRRANIHILRMIREGGSLDNVERTKMFNYYYNSSLNVVVPDVVEYAFYVPKHTMMV